MPFNARSARVLIYSHDSFGLGHLRRCRTIAHSLVAHRKGLSVLILSGSPIIGSFDFRARVDFVRVPGVIKLRNGEYSSLSLHLNIDEVLAMRASIIQHTAKVFTPDVLIVDKEPFGLRGEIHNTLRMLKKSGTRLVLGLRDIMDEPVRLSREWKRKNPIPAFEHLYDHILIYGLAQIYDPLVGIELPETVRRKVIYTGYLRTHLSEERTIYRADDQPQPPYLLVTPGGGGDGEVLVEWVLSAYECENPPSHRAIIVFGPFMSPSQRKRFELRIERLAQVQALIFDARIEHLMTHAAAIVAMGGYNTFCDILTFDKPALLAPRRHPRMEQFLRAFHADRLGLVRMLTEEHGGDAVILARILSDLPQQPKPSEVVVSGLLDGLNNLQQLFDHWLPDNAKPGYAASIGHLEKPQRDRGLGEET